jgi:hypothetical protein
MRRAISRLSSSRSGSAALRQKVVYLALRPYDTPRPEALQPDRRGPWDMPVYQELILRGIAWAARRQPLATQARDPMRCAMVAGSRP